MRAEAIRAVIFLELTEYLPHEGAKDNHFKRDDRNPAGLCQAKSGSCCVRGATYSAHVTGGIRLEKQSLKSGARFGRGVEVTALELVSPEEPADGQKRTCDGSTDVGENARVTHCSEHHEHLVINSLVDTSCSRVVGRTMSATRILV